MPLPDFIIAGERRCGTTTLANLLAGHPDIFMHPKRDSGWFVDEQARKKGARCETTWESTHTADDYKQWFAAAGAESRKLKAEKSADYLFWRACHKRLADFLPDTRFIFTLRNPVERAWSHYWNEVAKGRETLDFNQALDAEEHRAAKTDYDCYMLSYRARGEYDMSLEAFLSHIPMERVLVATVEAMRKKPDETLKQICRFIGAGPDFQFVQPGVKHNTNWAVDHKSWARSGIAKPVADAYLVGARQVLKLSTRDRVKRREALARLAAPFFEPARTRTMQPNIQAELKHHFKPHIEKLARIVGRSFDEWE